MDSSDDRVLLYVLKMCVLSFLAQPACPCFGSRGDHVRFDAFSRYVKLKLILLHNPFSFLRCTTHTRAHAPTGKTPLRRDAQQVVHNQGQGACFCLAPGLGR
jgi:hypothetical protein